MNKTKGIILTIVATISYGFIPLFAKSAYANGLNPFTFSLFRSLFATVQLYLFIRIYKIDIRVSKAQYKTLLKVSIFGYSLVMLTLSISFVYISTGLAMTLHFIYPVLVLVVSIFFYNEEINFKKISSLFLSVIGIYFLIGFGSIGTIHLIGFWLAILSGVFYAYYILVVANGNIKGLSPFVITFYLTLFNTYFIFLISVVSGKLDLNYNYKGLLYSLLTGFIINFFGAVSFQTGLKYITASTASIISTFEPITSLVVSIIILNEHLVWYNLVGSIFIILSVFIVFISEGDPKSIIEKYK